MKATTIHLLPVLTLVLLLGCSDDNVVDPGPQTLPLQGKSTLTMVQAAGMVNCEAPDGTIVGAFPARFDALAEAPAWAKSSALSQPMPVVSILLTGASLFRERCIKPLPAGKNCMAAIRRSLLLISPSRSR